MADIAQIVLLLAQKKLFSLNSNEFKNIISTLSIGSTNLSMFTFCPWLSTKKDNNVMVKFLKQEGIACETDAYKITYNKKEIELVFLVLVLFLIVLLNSPVLSLANTTILIMLLLIKNIVWHNFVSFSDSGHFNAASGLGNFDCVSWEGIACETDAYKITYNKKEIENPNEFDKFKTAVEEFIKQKEPTYNPSDVKIHG